MAALVTIVLAIAGLAVDAAWVRAEPEAGARTAALAGCGIGLVVALVIALAAGKSAVDAVAIGLIGAAVLPLALLGQIRLVRTLTTRR